MQELIISEKPTAAQKIAKALADGKPVKDKIGTVSYYKVTRGDKDIIVASTVGHIFGLGEKSKGKWTYPVFDIEWKPLDKVDKKAKHVKKYITALKTLCKQCGEFTVACDYDIEGEVIGLNIIRYLCKRKDANRMKFSTLTKPDLEEAYDHKSNTLDWGQANAGATRHELDWYWGVNLSRALTASIKSAGRFKLMSSGRVQGPALKLIVDKEKEIEAFKPEPYWQIHLIGNNDKGKLEAWHSADKFWKHEESQAVLSNIRDHKEAQIADVDKSSFQQRPPFPFDLTSLQTEAYRCLRISPKETLALAQELYLAGYISYPRTSSQKLPPAINYKRIMEQLAKQDYYKEFAKELLSKAELKPNEGKKTDPAHPAIYPTGNIGNIDGRKAKLYDLIVRRFFSTFGEPATREKTKITVAVNGEQFLANGIRTAEKGWHRYYGSFAAFQEEELPDFQQGEPIHIEKIEELEKETAPPRRYTPASIIKELEKHNLGTKATRSHIIDTLYQRGYVDGQAIEATELGISTVEILEKYCPTILDEELTRQFEEEMEEIRQGKKDNESVLAKARTLLTKTLEEFRKKEGNVGEELLEAHRETQEAMNHIGKCPNCDEGELYIRYGKFGKFVACNRYPDCETTFKLPANGLIKPTKKSCSHCSKPMVQVIKRGKRPQEVCINPDCPSKQVDASKIHEHKCPKCGGDMVLRKSVYGSFLACNRYPKCRHTERIKD